MKLLLIAHRYPPDSSPRAFRWSALARHWASLGHDVRVVSALSEGTRRSEMESGVRIERCGRSLRSAVKASLSRAGSGGGLLDFFRKGLGTAPRRALEAAWAGLRWPDADCLWYPPALLTSDALLAAGGYDAFVTVSEPFGSHLVGLALKKRHPDVRWLADVGDPFSLLTKVPRNNPRLFSSLNRRFERAAFMRADATAFTVEATRAAYARLYPQAAERFHIVGPVVPASEDLRPTLQDPAPDRVKLVFSGTLDRRTRDPAYLLRLFGALRGTAVGRRCELHFYGNASDCAPALEAAAHAPGSGVFSHGFVPKRQLIAAVRGATVLVNIGFNELPYQLPSKAPFYAAAGRPILNISFRDDDCSARFFEGYPALLSLRARYGAPPPADVERLAALLAAPPSVPAGLLERWTRPYTLQAVSDGYLALLKPAARR